MFLQKQLKKLRDILKKCLYKRNRRLSRSGAPARELPKCQFFWSNDIPLWNEYRKPSESNLPLMVDLFGSPFSEESVITPPSPSSIDEVITETPIRPSQPSRKEEGIPSFSINTIHWRVCCNAEENHRGWKWWRLFVLPQLNPNNKRASKEERRLAKIEISQLLYDMQYGDEKWTSYCICIGN